MKNPKLLFASILLLIFSIYSCNIDEDMDLIPDEENATEKKINSAFLKHDLKAYKITPVWQSAITFQSKDSVEVNFLQDNKVTVPLSQNKKVRGRTRLLLTFDKGKIKETLIEYIPSDNFTGDIKEINCANFRAKQFEGAITMQNLRSTVKTRWQLEQGKIIGKASTQKPQKSGATNRWVPYLRRECTYNAIGVGDVNNSEITHWFNDEVCNEYWDAYWVDDEIITPEPTPEPDPTPEPGGGGGNDPTDPGDEDECANLGNTFDSSSGQDMSQDISSAITFDDGHTRWVTYTRNIYEGYGTKIYSVDKGVHNKTGNVWEWESISHANTYQTTDSSLFVVTHTVNSASAYIVSSYTAHITINYNVKSVLECGGAIIKTKEENFNNFASKSPIADGD